ncbi:unnamed protein product [[Candida] boidinii]|uniref:Unnamed protein product n=1 Tax=Candida boidinii TaxID=5477 RepID=A0A9W6T7Y0_CANBO|nr:unnamed protein product [[Candida] boidinii]
MLVLLLLGHPPESFPSPTRDVSAPIIEEDEPHVAGQVPEVSSPTPIRRRASMVDDALKYLTPEEVARMNTPVSEQIKQYQSKSRSNSMNTKSAAAAAAAAAAASSTSRSRSNSLTKKPRSRSNSLLGRRPSFSKKEAPAKEAEPKVETPVAKEAEPVTESDDSKKLEAVSTADEPSALGDDDSVDDEAPPTARPVFTEVVDSSEEPAVEEKEAAAPVAAKKDTPKEAEHNTAADDEYDEVVSYKTVSSDEFEANKDDPNYMEIET